MSEPSRITLNPDAINAGLKLLLGGRPDVHASFVDGCLQVRTKGLAIIVQQVTLGPAGLDVRLALGEDSSDDLAPTDAGDSGG
ncbi:MAG: hypothetical protein IT204_25865 [Fimbriimonadaceae bacterium]|nr:hypothetical protein [Fimbriimonadaceae bacterium]